MRPSKTVDNKRIVSALDRVDWDFPRAGTWTNALHSLHWFPGNFIPQIPSYLIELLSQEGDIVFDPFAGNCTTGVEALMLNRTAWISDFSPVSHLISRAKLELLTNQAARERTWLRFSFHLFCRILRQSRTMKEWITNCANGFIRTLWTSSREYGVLSFNLKIAGFGQR